MLNTFSVDFQVFIYISGKKSKDDRMITKSFPPSYTLSLPILTMLCIQGLNYT